MDRRNTTRSHNAPPQTEEPQSATLIPEHIVDHASQRLFVISIFAAIQCWKIYDILLVKADAFAIANLAVAAGTSAKSGNVPLGSFTSLNNFTFVLKYALIDGLFIWLLPVLNIPLLTFSPLMTLLLTAGINSLNFVLTSNSALPLLSSTFVPLWNFLHKHKELTILGDSVAPQNSIDMNSHFRGRYTIQYLPESSVMLNPFQFGNMCLESPESGSFTFPSAINLPIEFNTTNDVGFISIQRLTPDNTVDFLNYSRSEIRKLAKRDYSGYAKLPGYISNDERVFYLDAEIRKPGKYKIHRVLDVDGMVIRPYKSEFTIGYCPSATFVYPGSETAYSGYKCFSKDVSDLSWTVPMVSAFGMLPLTVQLATYQNGKKVNTFEKTISDTHAKDPAGLSWLQSHKITRNSVEQELLRAPQDFKSIGSGRLEFQILSVSDSHGNQRLYNVQSKDKDVNFPIELKKAPSFTLRDKTPARKLVFNSSKTLYIESTGTVAFPIKVTLIREKEGTTSEVEKLEYSFNNQEELANGLQITEPGKYSLLSGSDKYCPCLADSTPVQIVRPPLPSVRIKDMPIFDKCVGTIGYEFDLQFQGSAPFEISYEVFKNSSGILKPVLSDRGLKQHKKKSLQNDYNFHFKPNNEGNYILVFKSIKDLHYNRDPVPVSERDNTFSTYIKKRTQFFFFKNGQSKVHTIYLCKDQSTQVPVYFEGHFPFSFNHDIVDLKSGKVLKTESHEKQFKNSVTLEIPTFVDGGEYGIVVRNVTDNLGCSAEMPVDQEIRIRARKDTPSVEISESASTYVVEGDAVKIPLNIKSSSGMSSDDNIVYSWTSLYDANSAKNLTLHGRSGLVVREEGVYKLESFANAGCSGLVKNQKNSFTVHHYPKPNLTVVPETDQLISSDGSGTFSLRSLCQDDTQKVKVQLQGKKPYLINYEIKFPSGRVKSASLEIDNDEVMLPLPTSREGRYQITFSNVFDALYTKEKLSRLRYKQNSSTVTYDVKAHPVLRVKDTAVQICETKVRDDFDLNIPVTLDGIAPFRIEGTIINKRSDQSRPFVIKNLREPVIHLKDLDVQGSYSDIFAVGEHLVKFENITDASHCKSSKLVEANTALISITKVPKITKHKPKEYYCVGDRISYNMSGISPFVVYYKFNEENRRADSKNEFTRLATKPGELAIVALQDSSSGQCLVNYTRNEQEYERLKLRVHDLPSVEISHGDSIIKNLHQGDQSEITFKFIGTPPFSVTYVRTLGNEADKHLRRKGGKQYRGNRKVVDTKTVRDIWDYEYSDVVSLQGTYEAIEVTDAFCRATRDIQEIL
ncbi:hypothetical protein JCM33374_g4846 [Metschnikowia sp. JCM 33374]|nr:hypothetical protein JCM33374_g4846 [Metschnikowia sp. JCM 33374]